MIEASAGLWLAVAHDHVFWRIKLVAAVIEKHGQNDVVVAWLFKLFVLMLHVGAVSVSGQAAEVQAKDSVAVEMQTRHQDLFRKPNLHRYTGSVEHLESGSVHDTHNGFLDDSKLVIGLLDVVDSPFDLDAASMQRAGGACHFGDQSQIDGVLHVVLQGPDQEVVNVADLRRDVERLYYDESVCVVVCVGSSSGLDGSLRALPLVVVVVVVMRISVLDIEWLARQGDLWW